MGPTHKPRAEARPRDAVPSGDRPKPGHVEHPDREQPLSRPLVEGPQRGDVRRRSDRRAHGGPARSVPASEGAQGSSVGRGHAAGCVQGRSGTTSVVVNDQRIHVPPHTAAERQPCGAGPGSDVPNGRTADLEELPRPDEGWTSAEPVVVDRQRIARVEDRQCSLPTPGGHPSRPVPMPDRAGELRELPRRVEIRSSTIVMGQEGIHRPTGSVAEGGPRRAIPPRHVVRRDPTC